LAAGTSLSSSSSLSETLPLPAQAAHGRRRPHVCDLLLPVALGLWAFGISQAKVATIGPYGLPPNLPVALYAGVGLLVVSAVAELARGDHSSWRMASHAIVLVLMLYGIAPLVYAQGRYEWLYKTVGPVQYISVHGRLDRNIDIYQNWPGFFAFAAWFDKVAGVANPLAFAKWAQLAFELAALPILYLSYDALSLSARQRWVAILLYSASNWIGQDYFSPQALGTVLGLGIMALALRWLYPGNSPPSPQGKVPSRTRNPLRIFRGGWSVPSGTWPVLCALLLCYIVLTFTHELSPYILAVQFGALAAVRLVRPRWLPAALLAIAIAYLAPRYSFVNSRYGLLSSIGNFFGNATPPAFSATAVSPGQRFIERCAEALSLGVWLLAAFAAWRRRRSGRLVLTLVLLAYSPAVLLGLQAYGHEGILRVYLFSLPWAAALASLVLAPSARAVYSRAPQAGRLAAAGASIRRPASWLKRVLHLPAVRVEPVALRAPLALGVALALFFPAFFGDDSFNRMPSAQVAAMTSFWRHARPGPVYVAIDDAPVADSSRYSLFPLRSIFGVYGLTSAEPIGQDIADILAWKAARRMSAGQRAYVVVSTTMVEYSNAYGITRPHSFAILLNSLANSAYWTPLVHEAGLEIYELRITTASPLDLNPPLGPVSGAACRPPAAALGSWCLLRAR
jgi:hypothetical protein